MSPANRADSQALICQHEQSLRDNLIVFSTSAVFDISGMVAFEQTIILLISLVFCNLTTPVIFLWNSQTRRSAPSDLAAISREQSFHIRQTKYCTIKCQLIEPLRLSKQPDTEEAEVKWWRNEEMNLNLSLHNVFESSHGSSLSFDVFDPWNPFYFLKCIPILKLSLLTPLFIFAGFLNKLSESIINKEKAEWVDMF